MTEAASCDLRDVFRRSVSCNEMWVEMSLNLDRPLFTTCVILAGVSRGTDGSLTAIGQKKDSYFLQDMTRDTHTVMGTKWRAQVKPTH